MYDIHSDIIYLHATPYMFSQFAGLKAEELYTESHPPTFFSDVLAPPEEKIQWPNLPKKSEFKRLGRYVEAWVSWMIGRSAKTELIVSGLQVFAGKQTVGEFDYLFREVDSEQIIHMELAVKFFLGVGSGHTMSDWVGPMTRDRLDLKVEKLVSRQIRLGETDPGKKALQALGIKNVERRILLKGELFKKWDDAEMVYPDHYNPRAKEGFWLEMDQLDQLELGDGYGWAIIQRLDWLSGIPTIDQTCFDLAELKKELAVLFERDRGPQMVTCLPLEGQKAAAWKGFVVPGNWETDALEASMDDSL